MLVLLTRTWRVRKQAQHTVRKLLAALGGVRLAYGMLDELRAVLDSHKVSGAASASLQQAAPLRSRAWKAVTEQIVCFTTGCN